MATRLEIDRTTLPKPKELDLTGYQLLIVGSEELPLTTFLDTLRNCQDIKNLAKNWRNLGARLGVHPKVIHELGREEAALKKSQAIYELIKKWSNLKREAGHQHDANLKTLIECIRQTGTFAHIAKELQRTFHKQVKGLLGNREDEELKEKPKEVSTHPKAAVWKLIGKIRYNQSAIIHKDSHTVVFRGRFEIRNAAVKKMAVGSDLKDAELLLNGVDEHTSILKYLGMERDHKCIYLASDPYDGTLEQGVKRQIPNLKLNSLTSLQVLLQITEGVAHLHRNNVVHGNLNPGNVLLVGGDVVHAKIADVGIRYEKQNEKSPDGMGNWKAPELRTKKGATVKSNASDIYSLGGLFYFVLSGGQHLFEINNSKLKGAKKNDDTITKLASLLIQEMTDNAPKKRPKADDILSHHPMFWEKVRTLN